MVFWRDPVGGDTPVPGIGPSEEAAALLGGLATAGAWEMALQDAWWKDVSPPGARPGSTVGCQVSEVVLQGMSQVM